ncbi:hypothetical protein [Nonomuraea pusilla]|uniref:Uncharacterized protein n=1 Tax=Nonomuraea pusilla TaxID=46177 RepID=A0A1H8KD90_9ACTN|nr:hypothetical protein [Nonomuraea pusilla]SEN90621.1 hypothetical protein SAMN05660976_08575 [Nonomuraea pusilla]
MIEKTLNWTDEDGEAHTARLIAEHGGHKQHWCVGNIMRCSCGEAVGRLRGQGLFVAQSCRVCPLGAENPQVALP